MYNLMNRSRDDQGTPAGDSSDFFELTLPTGTDDKPTNRRALGGLFGNARRAPLTCGARMLYP